MIIDIEMTLVKLPLNCGLISVEYLSFIFFISPIVPCNTVKFQDNLRYFCPFVFFLLFSFKLLPHIFCYQRGSPNKHVRSQSHKSGLFFFRQTDISFFFCSHLFVDSSLDSNVISISVAHYVQMILRNQTYAAFFPLLLFLFSGSAAVV